MRTIFYFISLFFGCNSIDQQPPAAIVVESPKSIATKIDFSDTSYLKIKLFLNSNYQILLGRDSLTTKDIKKVDEFISLHLKQINRDKIIIIGDSNTRYSNFKYLKSILKKYEFFKFKIVTDDLH